MSNTLLIILSLIASAFFSGMEIAFVSANRLKIELDRVNNNFPAKILTQFIKKPSRFISTLLLGNNVALVIYGIGMARLLEPALIKYLPGFLGGNFMVLLIQTIISTLLILFVAEFLPKVLFRINPNRIISFFSPFLVVFYWTFYPVIFIFIFLSETIINIFFKFKITEQDLAFSPIDLDNYVKEFSPDDDEDGELSQEIQMFQNAIEFSQIKMRECMVPRNEIEAIEENIGLEEVKQRFISTGFSRILVYKDSIDNIIGYIHAFDLFSKPDAVSSIIRTIEFVPETMTANDVFQIFMSKKRNISVVVDEFGGTSGIVTMEDIMEEIFGEIHDEYDVEDLVEHQNSDTEYVFSGRLEIDYLNDTYKLNLPTSDEYETLAGLIIKNHEDIPDSKELIQINHFLFKILEVSDTKIEKVMLTILDK